MNDTAADRARENLGAWPERLPRPAVSGLRLDTDGPWPALWVQDGPDWVSLHSHRNPLRDAARQLDAVEADESTTLMVIGLGLGYILDELDRRAWTGKVVAFEPDPAIAGACLCRRDLREWLRSGRLSILPGPRYQGLAELIPSLAPNRPEPVFIVNLALARVRPGETAEALRRAETAWFEARANQEAKRQNAGRYLLNTLRNVPVIRRSADAGALVNQFAGVPAIVVAAGPSLDRNLGDIAAHREQALLLAVDTALRPLLAAGIEPDLVVGVDPTEANARHLAELPGCPRSFLVAEASLDAEALPAFDDRTFFFRVTDHAPWPWLGDCGLGRARLRAWGSVLTTAFDLAVAMGCDPIVFAGADLAFSEGRPYARGTTYEEEWVREQAWGQSLDESWALRVGAWPHLLEPDVTGTPVRTAPHLRAFRDWIVREAARLEGRTVVNATPAGILIGPGIELMSIGEALSSRPAIGLDVNARIRSAYLRSASTPSTDPVPPPPSLIESWAAGSGVPVEAIAQAACIERAPAQTRVDNARRPAADQPCEPTAGQRAGAFVAQDPPPGLSAADQLFLKKLSETANVELVVLDDPTHDLAADLRRRCRDLTPAHAVAVVDQIDASTGAQVRRAIDRLLCDRTDLWLEYRRFVDHDSRVSVIRRRPSSRVSINGPQAIAASAVAGGPPSDPDAAKWQDDHRPVALRLAPIIAGHFSPTSVVDVGCGAGHWLDALASCGVTSLRGVTSRVGGTPVTSGIEHAPLHAVPIGDRRFDICLCLEIAQHLEPAAQEGLISACTTLSDIVVFSSRPPGSPDGSPGDRPLRYWAEKFWRRGFVLDEGVRHAVEHRWSLAQSVYDGLVAFRRVGDERSSTLDLQHPVVATAILDLVDRCYEHWLQKIWWAVCAHDRASAATPKVRPLLRLTEWAVPRVRLMPGEGGTRVFRFRTDAARWYLTDPGASIAVLEDGVPLQEWADADALARASGGWRRWRDEVMIKGSAGSDARVNRRTYALVVPAEIAWLESLPPDAGSHLGRAPQ